MIQKFDKSILSKDRVKEIFNFIKENNIDMSNIATKELFIQNGFLQCFLNGYHNEGKRVIVATLEIYGCFTSVLLGTRNVKDKNEEIVLIVKQSISYEIRGFSSKSSLEHIFSDDSILDSNIISVIGENGLSAVSSIFIAIEKFIDEMPKRQKKETEGDD